jgi:ribosomal protein S11
MKRFVQFLSEATQSQAAMQAKKLGLSGDGHGGWVDRSGKVVARTEKGKLKFTDGRQTKAAQEPAAAQPQKAVAPVQQPQVAQAPVPEVPQQAQAAPEQQPQEEPAPTVTVVFGRFNPPTVGHEKLLKSANRASLGGDLKIYPSRSQDPKKNPLDPDTKISYMRKMFPEYGERIINDYKMKTIFDVLVAANEEGYGNVNIIVGSDRQAEFENLAQKYNGDLYTFDLIRVISAGVRDADAEGVEGMSASKMRKAVMDDDFASFRRGTPKTLDDAETNNLFNAVRQGMGVKKSKVKKESYQLWQIAPKYDMRNLRENYVRNKIFRIGDRVENLNTGLVGEVMRRGTNHLICVTEEGYMFKSWIKDLMEYTEVKMDSPMRDKIHPNTLVGTLGAFKYFSTKTPGAVGTGKENLQYGGKAYGVNFINKYRKIKESIYSNGY